MQGISDIAEQAVQSRRAGNCLAYSQCIAEMEGMGISPSRIRSELNRAEARTEPPAAEAGSCTSTSQLQTA